MTEERFKPCKCGADGEQIFVQVISQYSTGYVCVVRCYRCNEFTPVKITRAWHEDSTGECIKAWNKFVGEGNEDKT